jgi:hypothetical protein
MGELHGVAEAEGAKLSNRMRGPEVPRQRTRRQLIEFAKRIIRNLVSALVGAYTIAGILATIRSAQDAAEDWGLWDLFIHVSGMLWAALIDEPVAICIGVAFVCWTTYIRWHHQDTLFRITRLEYDNRRLRKDLAGSSQQFELQLNQPRKRRKRRRRHE